MEGRKDADLIYNLHRFCLLAEGRNIQILNKTYRLYNNPKCPNKFVH